MTQLNNFVELDYEEMIMYNLIKNEDFRNTIIPILKSDYFKNYFKLVFNIIYDFYVQEIKQFGLQEIFLKIKENKNLDPEIISEIGKRFIKMEKKAYNLNFDFLISESEKWVKDRAIEKGVLDCINIMQNQPEKSQAMPEILVNALNVTLKENHGLNFMEDCERRFQRYKEKEDKIPFFGGYNAIFNKITNGGFSRKTLNVFMAGTGIGKTLTMCSLASDYIKQGYNVLYITLEISEHRISSRIDANLLNLPLSDLHTLEVSDLVRRFEAFRNSEKRGQLFIKEFPTGSINVINIKGLIKKLQMKHGFKADVIMIDYLNLMNPARNTGKNSNSYINVKTTAEELRGLAVETDSVLVTVTQTNRDGIGGEEVSLDGVSESAGVPHTSDFFCGIFQNEQQRSANIYVFKILKNRYSDKGNYRFAMGVSFPHMKIFQLDETQENEIASRGLNTIEGQPEESKGIFQTFNNSKKKRNKKKH